MSEFADWVNQYGFPIVAAVGLGYFIYYIWVWATTKIKPVIGKATGDLINLVDRVRMLDNDMIRLQQKLNMVSEFKEEYEEMTGKRLDIDIEDIEKMAEEIWSNETKQEVDSMSKAIKQCIDIDISNGIEPSLD